MQDPQLIERVREIVATIFDVPRETVTAESSPATIERWDSLGRLVLTVELEQEFGVEVPPEQSEQLTTIGAIVDWLASNRANVSGVESTWAR
jgi:acyl carrier protein